MPGMTTAFAQRHLCAPARRSSDTEAPFLDLNLSITNGIVSSKFYDKRDDFNFEIIFSHFLMEMFLALFPMEYIYFSAYSFCYSVL